MRFVSSLRGTWNNGKSILKNADKQPTTDVDKKPNGKSRLIPEQLMHRLLTISGIVMLFHSLTLPATGMTTARLQTTDTLLRFEAGKEKPRLISLQSAGRTVWINRAPEALIGHVEIDGQSRPVDFGSASHCDYLSITDTYDPLSNRRAFYDASHVLPAAMLECYVEKWPVPHMENFRLMLRSGMMGWLTIMLDTTQWTPEQHRVAQEEFHFYKTVLRSFIRDADLYHISQRPDGIRWDGIEYFDSRRKAGVVYAFRGSTETESSHTYNLQGLRAGGIYRLHFHDGSGPDLALSGRALCKSGLSVTLPVPNSSELILINEVAP